MSFPWVDEMKSPYTLLADGNLPISKEERLTKAFKAHLLYTLIFNEKMVLSDSQAISSANLRRLVSRDGVIRDLFKQGRFQLAVRKGVSEETSESVMHLVDIQTALLNAGGLIYGQHKIGTEAELEFMASHAPVLPWTYWDVRNKYTATCKKTLETGFAPYLSDSDFQKLQEIVEEETVRDNGLGRAFLQQNLLEEMRRRSIVLPQNANEIIMDATEAPYISNLPSTLDLSPIYAESHQRSFQLLRGKRFELVDASDPLSVRASLDCEHYVEGLSMLDVDDIEAIRDSDVMLSYQELQSADFSKETNIHDLQHAYAATNILIEERIIRRFPQLKVSTGTPQRREVRRKWARFGSNSSGVLDLVCMSLGFLDLLVPPMLGTGYTVIFEMIKNKSLPSNDKARVDDIAQHKLAMKSLDRHLKTIGRAEQIKFQEDVLNTESFEKEIMVMS